jgi:hypothetical protein
VHAAAVPEPSRVAEGPGEDPPARRGAGAIGGWLASGTVRPQVRTKRFDVAALPVAEWGPAAKGTGFSLRRTPGGWNLWVRTTLLAEILVAGGGPRTPTGASAVGFTAFTGGDFGQGDIPDCGAGHLGTRLAVWSGFSPAGWTDDGVDVEMGDGDYDLATCSAQPKRSLVGRAAAVVRGFVYALRTRQQDDEGRPLESLVVFMPRGSLVATASDPAMPLQAANTGPFTRLTFRLRESSAGTASVRVSPAAMALWTRLRSRAWTTGFIDRTRAQDDLLVGIDVAWQDDVRLGSISLALPAGRDARPYAKLLAALQ